MTPQTIGEGLTIFRDGTTLEYSRREGVTLWFEDIKTGSYFSLTESQFLAEYQAQRLLVLDVISSPRRLTFSESGVAAGPLSQVSVLPIQLAEDERAKLDRRADYIYKILKLGIRRGQRFLLADAAKRIAADRHEAASPSVATLNRWLATYEKRGRDINALISGYFLRRQSKRCGAENERLVEAAIDKTIFTDGEGKDSAVVKEYQRLVTAENDQRLTFGLTPIQEVCSKTISRRIAAKPAYDVHLARVGIRQARHDFRMATGVLPASYPLQVAEIDHTQINWWVIDDRMMLPLGLPWITIIRDRYSGMVLGIFITFRKTGLDSIFGALRHSFYAHEKIRELWPDISNPWTSSGFATLYVSDRGGDFLSNLYRLTIRQLGADYEYSERETPWHKAGIERAGGEFSHLFETMPGKTFPFRNAPRGYVAKQHAVVRFSAACYIIHKWICDIYHVTPHSRNLASPTDRWSEGIIRFPPPLPPSPEVMDVLGGELRRGCLSHEGIRYQWLSYSNHQLDALRKRLGRGASVEFVAQTREMGYVHVIDPETKIPFRVDCRQAEYAAGKTLFQHQYIRRAAGADINASNVRERLRSAEQQITEELREALAKHDNLQKLNLGRAAVRSGMNSNDVLNGKQRSVADLVAQDGYPTAEGVAPNRADGQPHAANQFTDIPSFSWGI